MKILVLNGSPKRDVSDTMHLTRAFLAVRRTSTDCSVSSSLEELTLPKLLTNSWMLFWD